MTVIVNDTGFAPQDWTHGFCALEDLPTGGRPTNDLPALAVDIGPETEPEALARLLEGVDLVRISFPTFADGRGFSLARRLRDLGYNGRLRARGHVLADQYAMARRSGFDEVEIDAELAARQPEANWADRSDWRAHNYQQRLRGGA